MKPLTIRLRLTLWYFVTFAAAAALLSVASWWMLQSSVGTTQYYELQERAEDVQALLKSYGPAMSVEELQRNLREIYGLKDDGKYLEIADAQGHWLYRSQRMADWGVPLPLANQLPNGGVSSDLHRGSWNIRMLAYPIDVNGRTYSVIAGLSLRRSRYLLSAFTTQLLLLTPGVLLLAAITGHFMSRKALQPVAAIATEARRINDRNLDIRLPVSATHDEISHLSETLNQMLERVEAGVRSIRDFTANAAHELRTPLALIRTEVEVALSLPRSNEEYCEACEQVQKETVRMTRLIDSLLMLARVDAGTETLRFEPVDLNQLAQQLGERWKVPMQLAVLGLIVHIDPNPAFVSADLSSLQRLLTILLDNASRYTPPGGSVELRVKQEEGRVIVSVSDTGIGIAPEHQLRVFDRFYRVGRFGSGNTGGSGLGLALAKWIAEKHGTSLMLKSAVGEGACFQFSIAGSSRPEAIKFSEALVADHRIESTMPGK
ncbi:sensor histidine kinase [Acidisarcina polymorpha]|uniref:histidine kinase n=1 Tax=Acidisarcina polymorpha TaxID=2211140 RepID=A0A2Z5G309_9BACT|nr:ATP-binding protein [Acidisarcina polymorpha]AXC13015.1 sensor histidine kinase [Acidisarcina polymorpha]